VEVVEEDLVADSAEVAQVVDLADSVVEEETEAVIEVVSEKNLLCTKLFAVGRLGHGVTSPAA
jgi:hypothetical protein